MIRIGNAVDNLLCLIARYLLVIGLDVAQVVAAVIVRFSHAHRVVREVDIAIVAEELWHRDAFQKGGIKAGGINYSDMAGSTAC